MAAATSGKDETAQLCQTLENLDFADNESSGAEKIGQVEQSDNSGGSDTAEPDDTEVFWRQMEAELKKTDTEEKPDAGEVPLTSGAGDGVDQHQQQSCTSAILVQEEEVMDKFQLPPLKTFYADLASIRTNKIVVVYPLTEQQLASPELVQVRKSELCLEYRIRHIRQGADSCFLSLYFASKASAEDVVEKLKAILPEEQVEFASQESHVNKMIASWSSNQKPNPVLPECSLLIKNIGNTVTVDKLKDLFPTSEDIVLPREKQDGKGPLRNKGYAYAVFLSPESANLAAESCAKDKPELDGHPLKVMKYFEPNSKPEGLLSLVERKLVLKQGSKSSSMIEKKKSGEEVKAIDSWRKKLQTCLKLMKRDNELRQELGLPLPSYDELCNLKDLPALDSKKSQQVMERLGIFFAKSTDKSTTSAASHKAATSASGSKTVKVQRSWYQEKRNKRTIHRPGMGRGLLGTPGALQGNMGGLLGSGPMAQNVYGQHGTPYGSGYSRFNYKGQYRNYPGNQRDLASSVGLLVNLSQMLAQQVQHQQQFGHGQQRPTGAQNMYSHGDYNRGGGKFGQQSSERGLGSGGHYDGYASSGQYHQNRPFYSGY